MPYVLPRIEVLLGEATVTLRSLWRDRAFTIVSVALLALGIGLTSAVVTLLWQVMYAQLPVPDPSHVYTLRTNVTHVGQSESDVPVGPAAVFSAPTFRYLSDQFRGDSKLFARHGERVNIETAGGSLHLGAAFVSGNFFDALGVRPILGRAIEPPDDSRSASQFAAVLDYGFWQETFGGQISAVGASIRVNGVPFRIVGIAPPHFRGLVATQDPRLYLPISAFPILNPGWRGFDKWSVRWLDLFLRSPARESVARVEAQLAPVYRAAVQQELANEGPQSPEYLRELAREKLSLAPAPQGIHAMLNGWEQPLHVLLWMTLAVLLLAAINVAGLMVVRSVKQRHEILIRYALGASRAAVVRLYFAQTLALSLFGGLIGIFVAHWGAQALVHLARLDMHGPWHAPLAGSAFGLHWAAAVFAGLFAGMLPAWHAARINLATGLNEGAGTHSAARSHARSRRILAAAQIALSLALLIAAGLFAKALHGLVSVPLGFDPNGLMVFSIDPHISGATAQSASALYERIDSGLRATPGVTEVSYGTGGPFPQEADMAVLVPGAGAKSKHQKGIRSTIGPGYFRTLGIPIVAGREFDQRDAAGKSGVVMIDEALAHKLYGDANPVGQTVTLFNGLDPNQLATIVGIVADHRVSWTRPHMPLLYTPASQAQRLSEMTFYVRTAPHARLNAHELRQIIQHEAPETPAYDIESMPARTAAFASGQRAMTLLAGAFAALALLIALVGIYGVIAYSSSLRTVEFGVRVAIGAEPRHIRALILREAAWILAGGLLLAAPLAAFGLQLIRTQLLAVRIDDAAIYVAAVALVSACSFAAALIPAWRVTRMNVQLSLRCN